mgnify:CR=1 FL=1
MENISLSWASAGTTRSKSYVCGYCGREISSEKGFNATCPKLGNTHVASIYICHSCTRPTFFDAGGKQTPGVTFGDSIQDISDESVQALYDEARKATGSGCYSLAVLGCRKLLMHIAVSKGAKPGDSFCLMFSSFPTTISSPLTPKNGLTIFARRRMKLTMKL